MASATRRDFLQKSGSALLVAALAPSLAIAQPQSSGIKRAWKKGYMLNAFPPAKGLSIADKIKLLKAAGFDGVEPNSHLDRNELLAARDSSGLEIASISCGDHSRMFSHPSRSERAKGVEGLRYALETACESGAKSVLVVAGGVNEKNSSYAENHARTRECIQELIPLAEKLGVVMAVENVWNNFLLSPLEAALYVDEFKSAAVGWHFDIGNVMSIGFPDDWIRILGKRIKAVHIKEFSRQKMENEGLRKGFSVEYLAGDNDWSRVMTSLDAVGYTGWVILEPACGECKQGISPEEYLSKVKGQLDKILAV